MGAIQHIVFLHGWGLNSAVWDAFAKQVSEALPAVSVCLLDLPGYGHLVQEASSSQIEVLAKSCLARSPENALWVGWSLGGMVAMQAAAIEQRSAENQAGTKIKALQLINSSPKFVQSADWPAGVQLATFQGFSDELAANYRRTLTMFLLLQAGANKGARALARDAHAAICAHPDPSAVTLQQGIDCLQHTDLRACIQSLTLPIQVVYGNLDRVTPPASSIALAAMLNAQIYEIDGGHAPFLSHPDESLAALNMLLHRIDRAA